MRNYEIKKPSLWKEGLLRIEWASNSMPVLNLISKEFKKRMPLRGMKISACLHVTSETANLMITLKSGGADVWLCASNPLSTQDDVAAALVKVFKIPVFAIKGIDKDGYYRHIRKCLYVQPFITMDDGADLVNTLHKEKPSFIRNVIGGTEETTTGVIRLRAMAENNALLYPIVAVNDAMTKHLFDNRYGTGQSTIDGILRATNVLLAGKHFVVCGYGWCGRGIALRAKGMGANVIVVEASPLRALEAVMDGFSVMPIRDAAKIGDIFCTSTGDINVIGGEHIIDMKDGAILANSGHFNVEIDISALRRMSKMKRNIRGCIEEFKLKNGKRIYLLADGRLVNLASAEGHPADVMDMSFANQALCVEYLVKNAGSLNKQVYNVPDEIDKRVAKLKLKAMGIKIDDLTEEQKKYLSSWEQGT